MSSQNVGNLRGRTLRTMSSFVYSKKLILAPAVTRALPKLILCAKYCNDIRKQRYLCVCVCVCFTRCCDYALLCLVFCHYLNMWTLACARELRLCACFIHSLIRPALQRKGCVHTLSKAAHPYLPLTIRGTIPSTTRRSPFSSGNHTLSQSWLMTRAMRLNLC